MSEALRLADALERDWHTGERVNVVAELRRLHAVNEELLEALILMLEDARHDRVTIEVFNQASNAIEKAGGAA
jgi:hypothetical protein